MYRKFKEAVKGRSSPTSPSSARRRFLGDELRSTGTDMVLYRSPRSRGQRGRAQRVWRDPPRRPPEGRRHSMQTRDDLYKYLGYHDYEQKLDALFAKSK